MTDRAVRRGVLFRELTEEFAQGSATWAIRRRASR
jgi:hypothetical protein